MTLVPLRCDDCGWEAKVPPSAAVDHKCPKTGKRKTLRPEKETKP